jgi:DNA-binding XRE family transcriptional regulator
MDEVKECKLVEFKPPEFQARMQQMFQDGWKIARSRIRGGKYVVLFTRVVTMPAPDTSISAARTEWLFCDRLRWLRWVGDLTLANLSSATGLSISYLSDMERGRTLPSLATLYKLAAAYNMTASDLLRGVVLREEAGRDNE